GARTIRGATPAARVAGRSRSRRRSCKSWRSLAHQLFARKAAKTWPCGRVLRRDCDALGFKTSAEPIQRSAPLVGTNSSVLADGEFDGLAVTLRFDIENKSIRHSAPGQAHELAVGHAGTNCFLRCRRDLSQRNFFLAQQEL